MQILQLSEVTRWDLETAGGKGANLGEMTRLGLPVPRGFVVTAGSYAAESARLGLADRVASLLARQDWEAAAQVAEACFLGGTLSAGLHAELLQAYQQMGAPAVAVRSSATMG